MNLIEVIKFLDTNETDYLLNLKIVLVGNVNLCNEFNKTLCILNKSVFFQF